MLEKFYNPSAMMSGIQMGQGVVSVKNDPIPNPEWSELDLFWPRW